MESTTTNLTYIYKIVPRRAGFAENWTSEEERAMTEHFAYLKALLDDGRLILAGPCTDAAFGIVIFIAGSIEEAIAVAEGDPSIIAGIMDYEIHQFKISLSSQ